MKMATNLLLLQMVKTNTFDAVLYATGRKPNTANIGLENTDITTNDVALS